MTSHPICIDFFCHNNFVSRDWLTYSPSGCADAEGGFYHGVHAGKSTIAADRIVPISPNTSLIFLARFVRQVTFVRVYLQSGDDSTAKRDEFSPLWLTVAHCLCSTRQPVIKSPESTRASKAFPCGDVCWRAGVLSFTSVTFYNGDWLCNSFKYCDAGLVVAR